MLAVEAPPGSRPRVTLSLRLDRSLTARRSSLPPGRSLFQKPAEKTSLAEQFPADDLALDLGGALVDAGGPDIPVQMLQEVTALEAGGPVDLDRRVHHPLG